ncbi:MAG: Gfo/Idh/MocA family oxidoreductase [Deltaproteobacteria bacterium]|nr:Gfo/Idh/MocA family oxidoreductase [Deltaproteobacteria bacterium]
MDSQGRIQLAVIGAGYWGPNLVRNFTACGSAVVTHLCDLDLSRAQKVAAPYPAIATTNNLEGVLASDIDAVAIATPVRTHFPLAKQALLAGKHVLVEKPLAWSVAEGQELVALAEAQGRVLMCDHTFCYTGAVRKMREVVQSGELGDVLYFDSVRVNLGLIQSDVNVLWDLAPHDLSILDYVLPADLRPVAVSAQGVDAVGTGYASVAYLTLHFGRPVIANVHANWLSPVKVRMTLVGGTKKMLVWDDNEPSEKVRIYDKGIEIGDQDPNRIRVSYRHGACFIPVLDSTEALARMAREFCSAITGGRAPETDGAAGLRVLKALEAANRSLQAGGVRVELA